MTSLNLPPYGYVNADNTAFLGKRPVPDGFRNDPNDRDGAHAGDWEAWLHELSLGMREWLWPVWEEGRGWQGAAAATAVELTMADLALMRKLNAKLDERLQGAAALTGRQQDAWLREDEGVPGATFEYYKVKFPAMLDGELTRVFVAAGVGIARPASQGLKRMFQRPRPFQVSMWWNLPPFRVMASRSAITPAMISGHCIQGTMALANAIHLMDDVLKGTPDLKKEMQQFLLDTGDRRVYAGLHYPSDNLSSWYTALRMCHHVFGANAAKVRAELWHAIQTQSVVYREMEAYADSAAFRVPLEQLARAANGATA